MKYIFSLLTMFVLAGCVSVDGEPFEEKSNATETISLAAYKIDCEGPFPQKCFVEILENGERQFFYETIEGFDFEAGYEYELLVEKKARCDFEADPLSCPQDVGLYTYSLKEILSQKESDDTFEEDFTK